MRRRHLSLRWTITIMLLFANASAFQPVTCFVFSYLISSLGLNLMNFKSRAYFFQRAYFLRAQDSSWDDEKNLQKEWEKKIHRNLNSWIFNSWPFDRIFEFWIQLAWRTYFVESKDTGWKLNHLTHNELRI